jgi:hypothetical protein
MGTARDDAISIRLGPTRSPRLSGRRRAMFCARMTLIRCPSCSVRTLHANSGSPRGPIEATDEFIADFRDRPIAYVVESYRLSEFPDPIRKFIDEHYVWYARSLFLAGFLLDLERWTHEVDVIAPGPYRWVPSPAHRGVSIQIGSEVLQPLNMIHLDRGIHEVATLEGQTARGSLMLADLPVTERDATSTFFYLERQITQLRGFR